MALAQDLAPPRSAIALDGGTITLRARRVDFTTGRIEATARRQLDDNRGAPLTLATSSSSLRAASSD